MFIALTVIIFLVFLQIINIQWVQGSHWQERAQQIGLQYRVKKATRGNIYSDEGVLLATSIPLYKLSIDATIVPEDVYGIKIDSLSRLLADFFKDKAPMDYLQRINEARRTGKRYLVLNNRLLTFTERKMVEKWPIFREGANKGGVLFEKVEERTYPFKELGARSIGYVNETGEGVGLEFSFEKQLAGKDGKALYQRLTGGDWKPIGSGVRVRPDDGYDIYTTLNVNIQHLVQEALKSAVLEHQANYGCAIVMDVRTGEIKAIANLGKVKEGEYAENYNYAIGDQGSTDPGSTFKIASMMALLEDSTKLSLTDTVETGDGNYRYYDRVMKDTRVGGYGKITVKQALAYSSNVGISKLVSKHFGKKESKYIDYLKRFGLSTPLESMRLKGIFPPYIKNPQDPTWSGVTLPWMSVGYETRLSPLQVITFFNAIANNGYWIPPQLVRNVRQQDKFLEKYQNKTNEKPICSPQTLASLRDMMEAVVEYGTAKNIKTDKYKIAGKTGTSQKLNNRGRYIQKYRTSFVGYFPADKPKYTCIVVIDEPKGADQYGGDVCAPVFRQIADRLYAQDADVQSKMELKREAPLFQTNLPATHIGHIEDLKNICNELHITNQPRPNNEWVSPIAGRYTVDWQERKIAANAVPNVKGLTLRDAIYLLENKGLKVYFAGKGRVKTQTLAPGAPLRKGDKIVIALE
jgi:cell division protein FtsI (penicillin-binding protein 3)